MHSDHRAGRSPIVPALLLSLAGCAAGGGDATRGARAGEQAGEVATPAAPAAAMTAANGEKVRCVDQVETGSRIARRTCLTVAEWDRIEEQSRELGRAMQGPLYGPREDNANGPPL